MSDYAPVMITWIDSGLHLDYGWDTKERYMEDTGLDRLVVKTVGLLMDENEESVVVGLNHDEAHDRWIGAQLIARNSILKLTRL